MHGLEGEVVLSCGRIFCIKEQFEKLDAMLQFCQSNKECTEMLAEKLEYVAWRLAKFDFDNVTSWAWISNDLESFLLASFLQNLELLNSSRKHPCSSKHGRIEVGQLGYAPRCITDLMVRGGVDGANCRY
jgi:hypothetical protein